MKITALVCITDPERRQDPWRESISSALNFADEVVVVCGRPIHDKLLIEQAFKNHLEEKEIKCVELLWPEDFSWDELPKHLNLGLANATGDWVIRFDIDYIFPENWNKDLRDELSNKLDKRAVTFQKFSIITKDKSYQKGPSLMGINRNFTDTVFGIDSSKYTDLCFPIIKEGEKDGVPFGRSLSDNEIGRTRLNFYNYDYTFKTEEFTRNEFYRFSKAHKKFFGESKWGNEVESALKKFIDMMKERLENKHIYEMKLEDHPIFIQQKIQYIKETAFGFDGWGKLT